MRSGEGRREKEDEMAIAIAGRTLDGVEIPAPGTWAIDPSHSSVGFTVRHLMVAKVHGRFGEFSGTIEVAERPEDSRAASSATTEIDREDFGLTWNQTLETGGVLVGKQVRIDLEVEAVRQ